MQMEESKKEANKASPKAKKSLIGTSYYFSRNCSIQQVMHSQTGHHAIIVAEGEFWMVISGYVIAPKKL